MHRVARAGPDLARTLAVLLTLVQAACGSNPVIVEDEPPFDPPPSDPPPSDPPPAASVAVAVDLTDTRQSIDGFGATTIPLIYGANDYLGGMRPATINAAYGQVGLTLGHLHAGMLETEQGSANTYDARRNDNGDPFSIEPTGFDFQGSDAIRNGVILPARAFGFQDLTLGPLLQLDRRQDWLIAVREQSYQRYLDESAEHVLGLVQGWQARYGEVPRLLTLFNEPTSGNTELRSGSVQEVVDLVRTVGQRLSAAGFTQTRFLVPNEETPARNLQVARAILEDPAARPYVGAIGFHPYPYGSAYASVRRILETSGAGNPDPGAVAEMRALRDLGAQYGVPVWMTEVTEGPARNSYPWGSMEEVLARAIHIHDTFEYANGSAFFAMNALWDSRSHEEHFSGRGVPFLSETSSVVLIDLGGVGPMISSIGYAIGHHARWVARGATRVGATSGDSRVLVSAFRSPDGASLAVVVVNSTTREQTLGITVSGGSLSGGIAGETTFGSERWAAITGGSRSGNVITQSVAASSVTTVSVPVG